MTADKIREVASKYKETLTNLNIPVNKLSDYTAYTHNRVAILSHVHWMLYEVDKLVNKGKLEKAFRWLGCIQGCFFSLGMLSLEDLKNDSRPNPTDEEGGQ
ncbi:MAG: hypothetical protein Q7K65_03370 [Candidatus Buchananbacteria bacterium]|nr:hypothetical protein [Candidatus Buchananbacteria bacterium]